MEVIACNVENNGDYWVPNSSKIWITHEPDADTLMVYMCSASKEQSSKAVTDFIVEKGMKGF